MNRKDELYKAACERIRELESQLAESRADALREAVSVVKANIRARDGQEAICAVILALLDQPQDEVRCECNAPTAYRIGFKFCPYCGKPIKIKE